MIVQVSGPVNDVHGKPDQGMVVDFGDLKRLVNTKIVDEIDHSFMYWQGDEAISALAHANSEFKMHAVPFIPTAECITQDLARKIQELFAAEAPQLILQSVQVYETPNCWALWEAEA
jgi:6-pyruvoyltetrahydropterin/6-carboxytetrahydropterin synthase